MAKGFPTAKVTISKSSDALYVYTGETRAVLHTESLGKNVLVDIGEDHKVAGIEFLGINGKRIEVGEVLDKYASHAEDSMLSHEDAYFLRALSLIEWNLI